MSDSKKEKQSSQNLPKEDKSSQNPPSKEKEQTGEPEQKNQTDEVVEVGEAFSRLQEYSGLLSGTYNDELSDKSMLRDYHHPILQDLLRVVMFLTGRVSMIEQELDQAYEEEEGEEEAEAESILVNRVSFSLEELEPLVHLLQQVTKHSNIPVEMQDLAMRYIIRISSRFTGRSEADLIQEMQRLHNMQGGQ